MNTPLFSCVVPVKGPRPYLDEALASLSMQGIGDSLEVIVQDGDIEPDAGQSDALNKGFAKAKGQWFFWLNADDLLLPGALKKVRCLTEAEGRVEWITGNQLLIDGKGNVLKCSVGPGWHDWMYRHAVPHVYGPSSFFRCELLERTGGFDTTLEYCMDWDLWIRFMRGGARYKRLDAYLWAQRQWNGSKTQRRVPPEELKKHWCEIRGMAKKNKFEMNHWGDSLSRIWRVLNGNIVRQLMDGIRFRGKGIRCIERDGLV